MKLKVFACLLLMDRLKTKDMLQQRHYNVHDGQYCVLCQDRQEETISRLFFYCSFSTSCWNIIELNWDSSDDTQLKVERSRGNVNSMFYMKINVIAAWHIWNQQNGQILENIVPSVWNWNILFKNEPSLHVHVLYNLWLARRIRLIGILPWGAVTFFCT